MSWNRILIPALLLAVSALPAVAFELTSPDFASGGPIAEKYTYKGFGCAGGDVSPALNWSDPPAGTKSFALLVHDPDAPTGGAGFWHWLVYDIPATATGLPEGVSKNGAGLPAGAKQVVTDFGVPGYGGPCPPKGDAPHHYHFTIYALKTDRLDLPPNATASVAGFMINADAIGKTTLTGTYGR